MFIIRETFIAKPGHAGELARLMKEASSSFVEGATTRVLLDYVTNYNKIVVETEVKSLAEFEKSMEEYKADTTKSKMKGKMAGYTDMYYTGKREIFRVVE